MTEPAETDETALRADARGTAHHHEWRQPFLEAFARLANVTDACEVAGVSRAHVYRVRNEDPEFAQGWVDAEHQAADRIHREMIRRGIAGVEEPVFGPVFEDGKKVGHGVVGTITRYSDRLLERLAEAHMPERFGTKRHEVRAGQLDPQDDVDAAILARVSELQQLALDAGRPKQIIDVEATPIEQGEEHADG